MVALLLFPFVATATAGDSWVFWVRKDYDAGLEGQWRVVAELRTREDCLDMMKSRYREAGDGAAMTSRDAKRGSFFSVALGGRAATAAKCVPAISDGKEGRNRDE